MILVGNIFSGINNGVPLSLTTIGSSGAATLDTVTGVLNIPIYSGGSGAVLTDNGISGTGVTGDPVILGGSALIQDTILLQGAFSFGLLSSSGNQTSAFTNDLTNGLVVQQRVDNTDPNTETNNCIAFPGSGFTFEVTDNDTFDVFVEITKADGFAASSFDNINNNNAQFQVSNDLAGNARCFMLLSDLDTGLSKGINLELNTGGGLPVEDSVDDIGLIGDTLFPVSDPKQYAQYGNITIPSATFVNWPVETDTQLLTIFHDAASPSNQLLRVELALFIAAITTDLVDLALQYTDEGGNAVNTPLATAIAATGAVTIPAQIINIQAGTFVSFAVTVTGGSGATQYHPVSNVVVINTTS